MRNRFIPFLVAYVFMGEFALACPDLASPPKHLWMCTVWINGEQTHMEKSFRVLQTEKDGVTEYITGAKTFHARLGEESFDGNTQTLCTSDRFIVRWTDEVNRAYVQVATRVSPTALTVDLQPEKPENFENFIQDKCELVKLP